VSAGRGDDRDWLAVLQRRAGLVVEVLG